MGKYNFDLTIDRRKTHSYKWDCNENEISLSIADTDFATLPEATNTIISRAEEKRYGYSMPYDEYFDSYVKWFGNRYNAKFAKEDCIFSTGIVGSLDSVIKRITSPNDGILLLTPVYNVFFNVIKNNNRKLVECPLLYKDYSYDIDWPLLEKKIKECKALIFCNPHNPTGIIFSKIDILKIADLCRQNNVYLLSDEIHSDFDYNEERYTSVLSCIDYDKLLVFLSPGKTFNLAGLQSSIIVVKNEKLREKIQKGIYEDDIGEPNYFAIAPVIAVYTYGEEYVKELNDYISFNRKVVENFLNKELPNLHLIKNKSTCLLWIDISYYEKPSDVFCDELRKSSGLIVCPGHAYGDSRFIRINIATSLAILEHGLNRLKKYIDQIKL